MTVTPEQLAEWKALAERRKAILTNNAPWVPGGLVELSYDAVCYGLADAVPALIEALEVAQRTQAKALQIVEETLAVIQSLRVSPPEEERTDG